MPLRANRARAVHVSQKNKESARCFERPWPFRLRETHSFSVCFSLAPTLVRGWWGENLPQNLDSHPHTLTAWTAHQASDAAAYNCNAIPTSWNENIVSKTKGTWLPEQRWGKLFIATTESQDKYMTKLNPFYMFWTGALWVLLQTEEGHRSKWPIWGPKSVN